MTVTELGFEARTFPVVREAIVALWKTAYGDNSPTDPETPNGHLIDIISTALTLAFETDAELWANSFGRSAVGQSLDRILDLFDLQREPAAASTGTAVFYGDPSTAVPASSDVLTTDTSARFTTDAASATGALSSSLTWMMRVNAAIVASDYTVTVDANPPGTYTAILGDTTETIARALVILINTSAFARANLAGIDDNGAALFTVDVVGGPGDVVASTVPVSSDFEDFEAVRTEVSATVTGALSATVGTLQIIATPITGIAGSSNDFAAALGQDREPDDLYYQRHLDRIFTNQTGTDEGVRGAVLALSTVISAKVVSNRTLLTDAFGRPGKSFETIVRSVANADDDQEIADAIASRMCAGFQPFGLDISETATTPDGEVVTVEATRVEELYLHLSISITKGESFPDTGDAGIANQVAIETASFFTVGPGALSEGKDMLRTAVATPVNEVTNTGAAVLTVLTDVTALPTDVPVFAAVDQPATDRQIILADASRITVTIV